MIRIRKNVFETNSSSTHSLTICSEDEYNGWVKGDFYWSTWRDKLVPKEEVESEWKQYIAENPISLHTFEKWRKRSYYTYDEYEEEIDMEKYEETYTTKSGDKIIAFGYYGYDG